MGKYRSSSRQREVPRQQGVHPLMRGLGCIFIPIVPIFSYLVAMIFVPIAIGRGFPVPPTWVGTPQFSDILWKLTGLVPVLNFLSTQTNLYANLAFMVVFSVIIAGIMSIMFGFIYRFFGPSQYGPLDVPPPRVKVKRYKR